jgi:hypothetical protein
MWVARTLVVGTNQLLAKVRTNTFSESPFSLGFFISRYMPQTILLIMQISGRGGDTFPKVLAITKNTLAMYVTLVYSGLSGFI